MFLAVFVLVRLVGVDGAVEFDGEFVGGAIEVEDEGADGVLLAEAEVGELFVAEGLPEGAFGRGLVAAEVAGPERPATR